MPRTNSRKRNRLSVASNLSPNAQEFIPTANNEAAALEREYLATRPLTISGTSIASTSTGNGNNPEVSNYPIPDSSINMGQRDLLTNDLKEGKLDCAVCYEAIKNGETIWNCRNCFQIMHFKCIMMWFIKSSFEGAWRCPACQNSYVGKPTCVCFCGSSQYPPTSTQDIPHSCGRVCGLHKKNSNLDYFDCQHKCTLLCHPGPCPQCVVQVFRNCKCGKTKVYTQCGQSAPILCENICAKQLNCKNHVCEKLCHVGTCGPCKKDCPQNNEESLETSDLNSSNLDHSLTNPNGEISAHVSIEDIEMLNLNPDEIRQLIGNRSSQVNSSPAIGNTTDELNVFDDYDFDDDDLDDLDYEDASYDNEDLHYENDFAEPSPLSMCYCGQSQRYVPCTPENAMVVYYSCGKLCEKKLSCKNHLCQKPCHSGQCEPCKSLYVCTCPCKKRFLTQDELRDRTSCTQAVPTCNQPCRKPLECGPPESPHLCEQNCHEGPCSRCELKTKYVCKCGNRSKIIKCISMTGELLCKKKCNKVMSCGKHRCTVMCCNAQEHICNRICNRLLNCRQHRCDRICHTGNCSMCTVTSFDELYCRCGFSFIPPPIRCGTRLPICSVPCSREHECGHPATHCCHDEEECPPCLTLTEKLCYGGHELRFAIPCHLNVSCGMPCGIPLPCQRHTCTKPCHPQPCNTGPCSLPCNLPKSDCGHPCTNPCHDGPCPLKTCKIMVKASCICGNLTEVRMCSDPKIIEYRLQFKVQSMSLNILESSPTIKSYKILECTTECAKTERNRRIALALQIRNPDLSPNVTPWYSDFMKEYAKKEVAFCNYIHEKLAELVTNAKQSKQNSRSHSFEVMKYEKRKLVHEYCEHFGCESVAYDAEPNRNVVAIALKEKSWLPNYSVVEVVQRESGCPRVNPFASIQKRNTIILNKKL